MSNKLLRNSVDVMVFLGNLFPEKLSNSKNMKDNLKNLGWHPFLKAINNLATSVFCESLSGFTKINNITGRYT